MNHNNQIQVNEHSSRIENNKRLAARRALLKNYNNQMIIIYSISPSISLVGYYLIIIDIFLLIFFIVVWNINFLFLLFDEHDHVHCKQQTKYHCNDNHTNSSVWYLCLFGLLCYNLDFDNVYTFFWRKVKLVINTLTRPTKTIHACDFTSTGSKSCTALHQSDIITVLRIFWYQANEWWMASNKQFFSFWNALCYSSRILCLQISNQLLLGVYVDWLIVTELGITCVLSLNSLWYGLLMHVLVAVDRQSASFGFNH